MKFSKDIGIVQEKMPSFYYVQNWSDPKLALWGIGLHNHVDSFRKWLIYGFIFLYTEYFTLLALYNGIFSSFLICFQTRKTTYGRRVEFLHQLEICHLLYIGSNDDALRVHLFHVCIEFTPADFLQFSFTEWNSARDVSYPSHCPMLKTKQNLTSKFIIWKMLVFLSNQYIWSSWVIKL